MKKRNFEKVMESVKEGFGLFVIFIIFVIAPGLPDLLIP